MRDNASAATMCLVTFLLITSAKPVYDVIATSLIMSHRHTVELVFKDSSVYPGLDKFLHFSLLKFSFECPIAIFTSSLRTGSVETYHLGFDTET